MVWLRLASHIDPHEMECVVVGGPVRWAELRAHYFRAATPLHALLLLLTCAFFYATATQPTLAGTWGKSPCMAAASLAVIAIVGEAPRELRDHLDL